MTRDINKRFCSSTNYLTWMLESYEMGRLSPTKIQKIWPN